MAKKPNLPMEIHDYFQKANLLHGYFLEGMKENLPHALQAGEQLLLAKSSLPHGRWEEECSRLFVGSLRTAQFYMQFAKHFTALPKAQASAVLFLETTLEGAAKAAKAAANGKPQISRGDGASGGKQKPDSSSLPPTSCKPETVQPPPNTNADPFLDEDTSDFVEKLDSKSPKKPPKQYDRSHWWKQWNNTIGPLVRMVDAIASGVGEPRCESKKVILDHLEIASEEMKEWMQVK